MKTTFTIVLLFVATSIFAQDWKLDFAEAKKVAAKNDQPIVLVFQGSDWCAPCIKLNKEVWNTEEFKKYAKDHYVMLQADFPRRRENKLSAEQQKQNAMLAEKYNKSGYFPFVVVLDKNGKVLGQTNYKKKPVKDYVDQINSFVK